MLKFLAKIEEERKRKGEWKDKADNGDSENVVVFIEGRTTKNKDNLDICVTWNSKKLGLILEWNRVRKGNMDVQ